MECGAEGPDDHVLEYYGRGGIGDLASPVPATRRAEVPCCTGCKVAFQRRTWLWRGVLTFGLCIAAAAVVLPNQLELAADTKTYIMIGAIIALPAGLLFANRVCAPAVRIRGAGRQIVLEIRDKDVADCIAAHHGVEMRPSLGSK